MNGIVHPKVETYLAELLPPRDPLLVDLERQAQKDHVPICGPLVGALLATLVSATRPRRVLELGTAIGYSAIWMGRVLAPEGWRMTTIELEPPVAARARAHLQEAGLAGVVQVLEGAALDILPQLADRVDFVFIDAVKSEYPQYFAHVVRLLRPGGVLVADNVLLGGSVADPVLPSGWAPAARDGIRQFTRMLFDHPGFRSTILPLRDGLSLSVRL